MNYMKINVLVIGGGTHHNALGVIRTLGISGYGVELITMSSLIGTILPYISFGRTEV